MLQDNFKTPSKSKMAGRGPQNDRWDLVRFLLVDFWVKEQGIGIRDNTLMEFDIEDHVLFSFLDI